MKKSKKSVQKYTIDVIIYEQISSVLEKTLNVSTIESPPTYMNLVGNVWYFYAN